MTGSPNAFAAAGAAFFLVVASLAVAFVSGDGDRGGVVLSNVIVGDTTPGNRGSGTPEAPATFEPEDHPRTQAVVSAHELATESGMDVLERGGTAADAAVAVAATLSVVEPWFSSVLGGGTWSLYYDAENDAVTSLDGVGPVGSLASVEDFAARAGSGGAHQTLVPGAWDGWMLWLGEYGRLDLGDVLAPAIGIAREGYAVSPDMAYWLDISAIHARPETAAIYAPEGRVLSEGETVYQHDLANTFEALVDAYDAALPDGRAAAIQAARDYYYRGPLAEAVVAFSEANGGYLTLDDFRDFEAEIVEPIAIDWDGEVTVYQNPPNSQGITQLIALNILKGFDFSQFESAHDPGALHLQIEALKLAFSDRHYHVGDPARTDVPVERLLSDDHADAQRARMTEQAAGWPMDAQFEPTDEPDEPIGDTTTFHIVDRAGNGAAVTTSLGAQFLVAGNTGIHLNNRMRFLALAEGDPNQLTPGYKVRHTSNPYMVFRDGELSILGGNTGVDTQAQVQLQQFVNIVEFGFSAQEAVSAPRFVTNGFPSSTYPHNAANTLDLEDGFPADAIAELERRGHAVQTGGSLFGIGAVLILEADGSVDVGADERNGTATGIVVEPE